MMKFKIYLNVVFGVLAFVIGLVYYLNHEYKIGNFIILVAIFAEIKALITWYFYNKKKSIFIRNSSKEISPAIHPLDKVSTEVLIND